jgi:hypothetical protein
MTFNFISGGNNQNFGFSGNAQDGSGGVPRLYMQRFALSYNTNVTISYVALNTTQMLTFQHDGVNQAIARRNGTQVGIVATQAVVSSFFGGFLCVPFQSGGFFQSGFTSEALLFSTSLSATDIVLLENSQSAFYGIAYTATVPSGFVTTWYDQSGNGLNAVQATAASQPRIVNVGVVDTEAGRPTITAVSQFLVSSNAAAWTRAVTDGTNNLVARRRDGLTSFQALIGSAAAAGFGYLEVASSGGIRVNTRTTPAAGDTLNVGSIANNSIITATATPTTLNSFINGSSVSSITGAYTTPTIATSGLCLFNRIPTDFNFFSFFNVSISEVVVFKDVSLPTIQRQILERNQGAYYGVTVA